MLFKVKAPGMEKAVEHWKRVVSPGMEQDILDAGVETGQRLIQKIREDAAKAGPDWEAVAADVRMQKSGDNVLLVAPAEAFDLEHGTEDSPPRALVRANVGQMRKSLSGEFSNNLGRRLFGYVEDL